MGKKSQEIDAYIEACPAEHRETLIALRSLVHQVRPGLVESMQYNMPAFAFKGDRLCSFSSRKNYVSLYSQPEAVDRHRQELGRLNVGKACIRFRKLEQISLAAARAIPEESVLDLRRQFR